MGGEGSGRVSGGGGEREGKWGGGGEREGKWGGEEREGKWGGRGAGG